jgi:hypothetical protein
VDDEVASSGHPVARANRAVDDVEQFADGNSRGASEVAALVAAGIGDDEAIGRSQECVEEELAILGASIAVAEVGIGGDEVVAVSFDVAREDAVVETEETHDSVRHRAHWDEGANGEVPGAKVRSRRATAEPIAQKTADVSRIQRDGADHAVCRGFVDEPVQ